ncbi:HhoA/HhoB/HtrA family serine endopeptidase [Leptolyngbya sp. FACHB-261]|uniref:HhoA/HhoB/HtrA family serine endopeptidase n=1 Tax=Leptolyngbya sp. FACHB-261 TaxID=2692806 RepID=UPI00168598A7|nr:HhoA/HhoB/HtrA family serine endopeptidase [Leptolyngbya sp. FACHB-261]MBD2102075.1 trypsin-like peptidase domain-containing protein [Leptolyngbya sp. FACHB-261]
MNFLPTLCRRLLVALLVAIFSLGCTAKQASAPTAPPERPEASTQDTVTAAPSSVKSFVLNFIADAAEKAAPAVVRIDTEARVSSRRNLPPGIENDPFFKRFFGDTPQDRLQRGSGSGFVIDKSGLIITNAHVVEGAEQVGVTLSDGRRLVGTIRGRDELTDLAVVKVDAKAELPTVQLGNSEKLRPGEWVIALGNPLGLNNSVTVGIISALGRTSSEVRVMDKRVDFIQTDAAINPGNSGGPLLNVNGEVVGINTAIIQGAEGIGFAIPISEARVITDQLLSSGKVVRPFVGIAMQTLSPDLVEELKANPQPEIGKVTRDQGVLVVRVEPGSPAQKAGVTVGDVILKVDGKEVRDGSAVQALVGRHKVGERVRFEIERDNRRQTLDVTTVQLPEGVG